MSFTKNSNLNIRINKYVKIPKPIYPLSSHPYQNWTDLDCLGGLDKGFYGNYILEILTSQIIVTNSEKLCSNLYIK